MAKKRSAPKGKIIRKPTGRVVIGAHRFAKISAVEGVVLTRDMLTRSAEFERKGMSADERRRTIMRIYRKA
ncbi:MAG TPA: hypothetical protein VFA58_01845 [Chthoniobacterales bacterium]|nr:hypothetical protein [Chthoniobacterales bacterium]